MADVIPKVGIAVGIQSARGTVNASVKALAGSGGSGTSSAIDVSDGAVLGDRESGDMNSGISVPTLERVFREVADLGFTQQPSSFLRAAANGLSITIQRKGNGATISGTPAVGECQPDPGIDALYRMAGLEGANGAAPAYVYTPAGTQEFGTILLLLGDPAMAWVLQDCVASRSSEHPPGGVGTDTFTIQVGSIESFQETTWWGFEYGNQASLSAPVIQGVAHAWGTTRSFNSMSIELASEFEEVARSNLATGVAQERTRRVIDVNGVVFLDDADRDFEYQRIIATSTPTDELSFQVGTVAGGGDTANAYKESVTNPETRTARHVQRGNAMAAEVSLRAVDDSEDSEYTLTFN